MSTLTLAQQSLLDRIRTCCLASPGGLFSGTHERINRAVHEEIADFLALIADGSIGFALLHEEEWNIWLIAQGVLG